MTRQREQWHEPHEQHEQAEQQREREQWNDQAPADMCEYAEVQRVAELAASQGLTLINCGDRRWKIMNASTRAMIVDGDDGNGVPIHTMATLLRSGP